MVEHIRYKVLTPHLTSTGLAHATIVQYRERRWNYPAEPEPIPGPTGPGGLWASRGRGQARQLQRYLWSKYGRQSVIHLCVIETILFQSSYRTKTNRLFLLDQVQ